MAVKPVKLPEPFSKVYFELNGNVDKKDKPLYEALIKALKLIVK